ncbi:MAG TPA: Rieske 2Fe-2S domain-containing protein [Acidimicrobiales bacterium]|nr:Rieske 2Fe-2S domain-containing protein [Acidimicrobiales bacterium]
MTILHEPPTRLSDGTHIEDLIDRENRMVAARVFTDPEIYELEQERLFGSSWIAVGHESEIPDPGDFVARSIGEDPVMVVRNRAGQIRILLNVCSHRGMGVCRIGVGTTRYFTCPYHGWKYDTDGRLVSVPAERSMYGDGLDRSRFSLPQARVATCGGIIFGNWDENAPSLEEYLGPAALYLRLSFERTPGGVVVAGPPARFTIEANWKLAADQFQGDAYHTAMLHRSMVEGGYVSTDPEAILRGINIGTVGGHHIRLLDFRRATATGADELTEPLEKLAGITPELAALAREHLSSADADLLSGLPPSTANVFPNVFWFSTRVPPADFGPSEGFLSFRIIVPHGPAHLEQLSWALYEKDAPAEVQERTVQNYVQTFGTGGVWEQDDTEAWVAIQRALRGPKGRQRWFHYGARSADPGDELPGFNWPGPARDDCQWLAWQRYFDVMTQGGPR